MRNPYDILLKRGTSAADGESKVTLNEQYKIYGS